MDNLAYDQLQQVGTDIDELRNVIHGLKLLYRTRLDKQWIANECMVKVNFCKNLFAKLKRQRYNIKYTLNI